MRLLDGKVAVVTGAGRPDGIGEATALKFAEQGASVVVSDIDRNLGPGFETYQVGDIEHLEIVARRIRELGGNAMARTADITRKEEVEGLIHATVEKFGRLDILVNNAGAGPGIGPFLDISEEAWDKTFDVNVKGTFYCMRAGIRAMLDTGGGKIVNVSSIDGLRGGWGFGAYGASKFAIIGMTQNAAAEFAPMNILINCVCPGWVASQMGKASFKLWAAVSGLEEGEFIEQAKRRIAIGRMATGEDIANAICFLASPLNTYVVGQAMPVEGGKEFMGEHY
jgi:NAD(P)-dependent dehydrogenase (short-subunit alcohol dehydrogenase family)